MVTPERISKWRLPSGQRPLRENAKVLALAERIREDGVIPGMLTLGVLNGDTDHCYIIDGQHRLRSFIISGLKEGYADVRYFHVTSLADINMQFVELNSALVRMRPDDFLRGLEGNLPCLGEIRSACPYVGYDQVRRKSNGSGPMLSMSVILRAWRSSATESAGAGSSLSAVALAESQDDDETNKLISFLKLAHEAWGFDREYGRLWGTLNLILCMWLYRRTVLSKATGQKRTVNLDKDGFKKCLMSLSANSHYLEWLVGRQMNDHDKGPAYVRIKAIFATRLQVDSPKKVQLPKPEWDSGPGISQVQRRGGV